MDERTGEKVEIWPTPYNRENCTRKCAAGFDSTPLKHRRRNDDID
jgi:hypothetical protein